MADADGVEVFISAYAEVSNEFLHRFPSAECVQQYLKTVSEEAGAELICQCSENRQCDSGDKTFTIKGPWPSVQRTRSFLQKFMSALVNPDVSQRNIDGPVARNTGSECIQETHQPIKNGHAPYYEDGGNENIKENSEPEIPKPIVMYDWLDENDITNYTYRENSLEKIGCALKRKTSPEKQKLFIEGKDHHLSTKETSHDRDAVKINLFNDKSVAEGRYDKGSSNDVNCYHVEIHTIEKNISKKQSGSPSKYHVINKQKDESKPKRRKVNNAFEGNIKLKKHINSPTKSVIISKKSQVAKEKESSSLLNKTQIDNFEESSEISVKRKKLKKVKNKIDNHDEDNSLKFACPECPYLAMKKSGLREHKRRAHRTKDFVCNVCNKIFGYGKDLNRHKKSHEKPQNCCDICGKLFKGVRSLADHRRRHDDGYEKPEFRCDLCEKSFSTKYVLAYHIKSDHLGMKRTYLCPTCGKSFTKKHSYLQHANAHLGIRPFKCDYCEKTFTYEKSLKEHKFMHDNVRRFKCDRCDKSFRQSSALAIHVRIHKEKKDYVCASCGREFSQKQALKRHERIHLGEKPFSCNLCGRNFTDASVLRRHMILIHKKEPKKWREDTVSHVKKSQYFIDVLHENSEKDVIVCGEKDVIVCGDSEISKEKYRDVHMNYFEQLDDACEENLCRLTYQRNESENISSDKKCYLGDKQPLLQPCVIKISRGSALLSDMVMPTQSNNHTVSLYPSTGNQD